MSVASASALDDAARLATLRRTGLLDSPREEPYDRLTRMASTALHAPVAMMSVIDADRHWFKSGLGLPRAWDTTHTCPFTHSFCRRVVESGKPLIVPDTREDPVVRDNPSVKELHVLAYAGVPLRTLEGHVIGAFAVADHEVHAWTEGEIALLEEFSAAAMHEVEMRGALRSVARLAGDTADDAGRDDRALPRFRAIVEAMPDGVCLLQEGLFEFTNGALAAMLAYPDRELLIGTSILDLVDAPDRERVHAAMQQVLDGEAHATRCEFTARRRDDTTLAVELSMARGELGERTAIVASLVDVSQRRDAERQLLRSERRLRALTDNAWDVVHTVGPDRTIGYVSPSVERVLGFTPAELVGRPHGGLVHPDDVAAAEAALQPPTGPGDSRRTLTLRARHKDGSWRDVESIVQLIPDEDGTLSAIIHTRDITEQKQAERALRLKTANIELMEFVAIASNEAVDIGSAVERCLEQVCHHHDWSLGHLYLSDDAGTSVSGPAWYMADPERLRPFRERSESRVFKRGEGLPGTAVATAHVCWSRDVTEDPTFTRRDEARASGLRGGIASPLLVGTKVVGVVEFFADRPVEVDDALAELLAHIGTQIGRVIERVQGHDALRQSEARMRSMVEMSHDAFVAMDSRGIISDWNGKAEKTFGWSRAEVIGRPMVDVMVPERHRELYRRAMRRATRPGAVKPRSRRFETQALHRDGHEFPVELSISIIPIDGSFICAAFLHDITARREAEEKLRQSEERYDLVARATSDVVWDWNVETGELTWSDAILRTCRYQREQVGSTMEWWYNHIHPADRERVITSTHAVLNGTADLWSDEYRFQRGDGSFATVLARGHVVRNGRSEAVRMIGSMVDITERKIEERAQRFIAQASALLDTSLDHAVILSSLARLAVPTLGDYCAIDVLDDAGHITRAGTAHADPAGEALLRGEDAQPGASVEGTDLVARVIRTRQPILVRECTRASLGTLGVDPRQRRTILALGTRAFMIVPLLTRAQAFGAMTFGVTEAGRSYDLMDLLTAEQLCQRAARTIDNGRLYDRAQRAVRTRDEVMAVVSHDLRNPLSTIDITASLLLEEQTERRATTTRCLDIIKRAAGQANRLIKDLLDLSSIEAGHFSVRRSSEKVSDLLAQAREMLDPIAADKSITLTTDIHGDGLVASADVGQIQRVFSNLVGNAIKFTPQGGRIVLGCEEVDHELRFSVTDSGPGIPPDQVSHVFDRYWQASRGDRRGAGLGLSIVRGIVEAHGGHIWVESRLGEGTTFYFTVPTAPVGGAIPSLPSAPAPSATTRA